MNTILQLVSALSLQVVWTNHLYPHNLALGATKKTPKTAKKLPHLLDYTT
jgi:hypothetical protein